MGHICSDAEKSLLGLPMKIGWLGLDALFARTAKF